MPEEISVVDAGPRPLAVVRVTTFPSRWPSEFMKSLDKVYKAKRDGKIKQIGHNVMVYYPRGDNQVDIECGIEVPAAFDCYGEVFYSETPSGPTATITHVGPYHELGRSHKAIQDWIRQNNHQPTGICWEIYGDWHEDPTQLRTDIFHQLRSPGS
jgi:effector-binding domain-containing protein